MKSYIINYCSKNTLGRSGEIKLFEKLKEGDGDAKNLLIKYNVRLVINIAKRYKNCGIELEDLIQEGIVGLIKAIEKFDYTKGFKFSTYATHWIKNFILKAIYLKNKAIKAPNWLVEELNKINKYAEGHTLSSFYESANALGISRKKIDKIVLYLNQSSHLKSLNDPINGHDLFLEDLVEGKEKSYLNEKIDLDNCISHLSKREQYIIKKRFYFGATLQEIGNDLSLTKERIRKIEFRALGKIKKELSFKYDYVLV